MPESKQFAPILPGLEAEFLPPMGRWATAGAWLLVGILVGTLGVAATTEYTVTVKAAGIVRPVNDLTVVRARVGGTVRRVAVRENQTVQAGEAIAEFGIPDRPQVEKLQARRQRYSEYIAQYQTQLTQIDDQLQQVYGAIATAAQLPPILKAAEGNGAVTVMNPAIDQALQQLALTNPSMAQQLAAQRDRLQQQRLALVNQIQLDQTSLQTVDSALSQMIIPAPIAGTILRLPIDLARPIAPGDVVAEIVPANGPLVIRTKVMPRDISQVQVGQTVQLRVSAYPYPDYGLLQGKVSEVAPDVAMLEDRRMGLITPYYEVTVAPATPYLSPRDRQHPIQPGMEVQATIVSRKETVLQAVVRNLRLWADV